MSKYNLTQIKFPNKLIPKNTLRRNIMGDILKEAIADAKAVRETALENAKNGFRRSIHTSNQIYVVC